MDINFCDSCVIPVAGMGKRLRPVSYLYPKELVSIGNIPLFAFILKEVVVSKMTKVILVVSAEKRDFFQKFINLTQSFDLFIQLGFNRLEFEMIEQQELNGSAGLGAATYSAKPYFKNSQSTHFALILPDVLIQNIFLLSNMIKSINAETENCIALNQVKDDEVMNYGIADLKQSSKSEKIEVNQFIEKPSPKNAPSNFSILGRYILSVKIFDLLKNSHQGAGGEIQITDSINSLKSINQSLFGFVETNEIFDCGRSYGLIEANQKLKIKEFLNS